MRIWRISPSQYVETAFTGIGASLRPGRWNSQGKYMVYCSSSLSLAMLEMRAYTQTNPTDKVIIPADMDDTVSREVIEVSSLPENWKTVPHPREVKEIGDLWLDQQRSVVLVVPSAVNEDENNYLLNPAHPDFSRIVILPPRPGLFDSRLFN